MAGRGGGAPCRAPGRRSAPAGARTGAGPARPPPAPAVSAGVSDHDDAPAPDYPDAPESLAADPDLPPRALQDAPAADDHWLLEPAPQPVRRLRIPVPVQLRRVRLGRRAALAGVAAILAVAGVALLTPLFGSGGISAVFNAPMLVVRAKVAGRVMTVAAMAGQIVAPDSPLLTLHVGDGDGPDRTIQAGVHGVIRSVETVPGADLAAGAALVRLQDCDRAFLTVGRATTLRAGETVRVVLPNLPPLAGTVRRSAGVMEPPDTLVVALPAGALAASCPVGSEGSVTASAGPDR